MIARLQLEHVEPTPAPQTPTKKRRRPRKLKPNPEQPAWGSEAVH